jgi:hypothetical protein
VTVVVPPGVVVRPAVGMAVVLAEALGDGAAVATVPAVAVTLADGLALGLAGAVAEGQRAPAGGAGVEVGVGV